MQNLKKVISKYKGYIVCILIIIVSSISILIQKNEKNDSKSISKNICVYIVGEVKSPGVYYVSEGTRLDELISIAGGITQNGDMDKINLSQKLKDSDKINIPKKEELKDNLYDEEIISKKVNINTANKQELMTLDGIGSSTADKIIKYRDNATFESIEDIMEVPSIGKSKFEKIKDDITVD